MYCCVQVFPAKEVYLYMGSRSSVSRNARTTWCMKYFNKVLPSRTKDEEVESLECRLSDVTQCSKFHGCYSFFCLVIVF